MPSAEKRPAGMPVKLLLIGDSGTGKTGSLAALANVGYELFIIDFDNGVEPLFTYVVPEARKIVHYETLQVKLKGSGDGAAIVRADAISKAMGLLNNWVDSETKQSYGAVSSWDSKRVLVIDSLTMFGSAALMAVLQREGKTDFRPKAVKGFDPRNAYGDAMDMIEGTLAMLYDSAIKCNVILISHKKFVGGNENAAYPSALGKALPPIIPRYFNTMLRTQQDGRNRWIMTEPDDQMATKSPYKLESRYGISNGPRACIQGGLGDPPGLQKAA